MFLSNLFKFILKIDIILFNVIRLVDLIFNGLNNNEPEDEAKCDDEQDESYQILNISHYIT